MRKFRRPNRPGPVGTVSMHQPSTSHANSQTPLASSSSTPSSTPTSALQQASNAPRDRRDNVKDDALDIAINIASVGKDAAGVLNVPGLAPALSALLEILKKIQVMSKTVRGVDTLTQDIDHLVKAAKSFSERNLGKEIPEPLQEAIDELTSKWAETERHAAELAGRNRFKRFLRSASDAKKLEDLVGDISSSIRNAMLRAGWDTHMLAYGIQQTLENDIKPKLDEMADQQDEKYMPPYAESAAFDANSARPRQPCLEGTREDILEDGWAWIKLRVLDPASSDDTQGQEGALVSTEDTQGFIHWTCGLAGTGKTTIACSIAKQCKEEGVLGASFFFSRFDSKCDNPRLLFTTISRQLCRVHPAYRAKVVAIMKNDPDITNSVPAVQFEKLILEPLEQLTEPFPRLVIVIDALDECRGDDSTSTIFYVVSKFKDRVARFFLLIMTSRPEPDIAAQFDQTRPGSLGEATTRLLLHTVQLEPVLRDIRHFFVRHLKETLDKRVPRGWPSDENIATLSDLSEGLFIFARTVVNLIMAKSSADPVKTLERVVRRQSRRAHSASILGELYLQVLEESHPEADEQLQVSIRRVVGALVVAAEPLSVATLAGLLELSEGVVWGVLSQLYSVLHIPDNNSEPIHFIHPTFPEFLLQTSPVPLTPLPPRFAIEAAKQNRALFVRSLKTMGGYLRYNIADLKDPGVFKKEIPNLQTRVQEHIPPHLSYACRNWSVHFRRSRKRLGPRVLRKFRWFLHEHLLHWLEACSLLNMFNEAPFFLDVARHSCQSLERPFSRLVPFLLDARRFTLTYAPCINAAPLQVYHSALGLAPCSSLVSQAYSNMRLKESLTVCRGALHQWGPSLDSFVGHSGQWMYAVAFSPDNTFLVSGGDDEMVKIWQASTRTSVIDIQTSFGYVRAVAYSPSGLHIVAGGDKGLSIWHAASGAQIRTITDDNIGYIAYTADGSRILSVSYERKVQLWRVSDGECLLSLDGDLGWQAGISPNGAVIAFIRNASVVLHDVSSGKHDSLKLPNHGLAATFSSDGRYVAAATFWVIQIWSHQDKLLVRSIDIDNFALSRLSFSPDGSRICYGDRHGMVHVWPSEGDGPARELEGHPGWVQDVAWSPDGSQIASASSGNIICLWDVSNHPTTVQPYAPSDRPSSGPPRVLVVKYQGNFMISDLPRNPIADLFLPSYNESTADDTPTFTSHPNRAAAWGHVVHSKVDMALLHKRIYHLAALTDQNQYSRSATIAISNDGSLVAYPVARNGPNICIRSLTTGELVATLSPEFESGDVRGIVFSPDDSLLASGSNLPATVAVWDVTVGVCVAYHRDHSESSGVGCATFSSDGRFVVSGSSDKTARVFDISTKRVIRVMGPHGNWVTQLILTIDDRLLVIQDDNGALYIWDLETGSRIALFPSSDEFWITALRFSPTGFLFSTEDGEHTVELWKVGRRAWPVYFVSKEGWLYAKGPGYMCRLAWLPPEWRHPVYSDGTMFCVCEAQVQPSGMLHVRKIVELDMSRLLDHARILYNK